jgi:hypothetical protein
MDSSDNDDDEEDYEIERVEITGDNTLDCICKKIGLKYFFQAQQSGDVPEFFTSLRGIVEKDYVRQKDAHISVTNFLVDSYRYYSRWAEVETREKALLLAYRDSFQYLASLHNDQPFRTRKMREDW